MTAPDKSSPTEAPGSRARRLVFPCGIAAVVMAVLAYIPTGPQETARLAVVDWLIQLTPKPKPPFEFALVVIDSSSLVLDQVAPEVVAESTALTNMAAGWPWSRQVYAEAIEKMLDAGAKLVILDVLLPMPRPQDEMLRAVIEKYPGKVVLVSKLSQDLTEDGHTINRYEQPTESVIPGAGALVGFANFWADSDGVVRSAPFRLKHGGGEAISSPAAALGALAGEDSLASLPGGSPFVPCMEGLAPDVRIPIWRLFVPEDWEKLLQSGEVFRDRVVAIGASATEFQDRFQTPVGTFIGAGLHLSMLGAAWEGALFRFPSHLAGLVAALVGGGAAWLIWALVPVLWVRLVVILAGAAFSVGASIASILWAGWMPPLFALCGGGVLTAVAALGSDLLHEGRARRQARRVLERYVSPGVAREILDNRAAFLQSLGGTRREVTVMFSDVRGFTTTAESGEPSEIFDQLNEYFGHMVGEVLDSGGGVDKFLGDGILAVWGTLARRTPNEEAAAAVACGLAMIKALARFNALREAGGLSPWKIGIGIHSGPVLFGNVGTESRMEPTIIGDTVNLTSRIEGLTKSLGVSMLISSATAELAGRADHFRAADLVRVVGRRRSTELFTTWPEPFTEADRASHTSGITAFRAGDFPTASDHFTALLKARPEDPLAALYLTRITAMKEKPLPIDWDGTFVASSK